MTVNWTDNADNEDGYRIYRNTTNTKPGSALVTLPANSTSYNATGLDCGTTYWWWVEAYNTAGTGEDSGSQATVNCAPTIIFQDTFTENSDTELSLHTPDIGTGWTQIISIDNGVEKPGKTLEADDNDRLDRDSCGTSDGALYQITDTIPSPNYEVSVFQIRGDTNDDSNIIAARIQDKNNMYAFKWNQTGSRLWKRINGTWVTMSQTLSGVNNSHTITLRVQGSTITVLDNGNTLVSVTDTSFSSAGKAGIGMGAVITPGDDCSRQRLDNFTVTQL